MSDRKHFISGLAGVLVGALLVAAAPAIATVGQAIIYGQTNTGDALTTLQGSANGALAKIQNTGVTSDNALSLVSDGPNLVISNGKKITRLNADRVDSFSANQLIRAEHTSTANAANANGVALTLSITAPFDGTLIIGGNLGAAWVSGYDFYTCSLEVDFAPVGGSIMSSVVDSPGGTSNEEEDCTTTGGIDVAAGVHTVDLKVANWNTAEFYNAALWAIFVPFDGAGAEVNVP